MSTDGLASPLAGAQRVLAIRLDNLGDVVLLGPALRALRAFLPAARIDLLASPAGAEAAPLLPWIDRVLVERAVWQDTSGQRALDPQREQQAIARLAAASYDAALVFTSWAQSPWPAAYACYLAGIRVRAGESKEFGGALLTHQAPCLPDRAHQAERNLHLLRTLGLPVGDARLEVAIPPAAAGAADDLLAALDVEAPFVAVAPGASCQARRYPAERFAGAVAALLAAGVGVVIVGAERERALVGPVLTVPGAADAVGRTSVAELAALLDRAAVAVTNDSGPMHLAAATGTPAVVLYSGTELVSQWAPQHSPVRLLARSTPCTPCYRFECPFDLACLDVGGGDVAAAALDLLAATCCGNVRGAVCGS